MLSPILLLAAILYDTSRIRVSVSPSPLAARVSSSTQHHVQARQNEFQFGSRQFSDAFDQQGLVHSDYLRSVRY